MKLNNCTIGGETRPTTVITNNTNQNYEVVAVTPTLFGTHNLAAKAMDDDEHKIEHKDEEQPKIIIEDH